MIKVAICDDDIAITGYAEELILRVGKSLRQKIDVTVFFSGSSFCEFIHSSEIVFDIVLMDIEMKDITGIESGRVLREKIENDQTLLIYISSHSKYYKDIIDLNVLCFIPKPFNITEFNMKVSKAIERVVYQRQVSAYPDFKFEKNGSDVYIPIKLIMYLESDLRKITLYTTTKEHTYYGSLNAEEEKLPKDLFCRTHRSYIICFSHMTSITSLSVEISGKDIPISSRYRDSVKLAYMHYRGI